MNIKKDLVVNHKCGKNYRFSKNTILQHLSRLHIDTIQANYYTK